MKARRVTEMKFEELQSEELKTAEELFRLRFQHHTGQLATTAKLRATRRQLARIKTRLRELEIEAVEKA